MRSIAWPERRDRAPARFDVPAQIILLAVLAAYFMVWPVWRAGFPIEIAQNEGWNAYHADAAMGAAPLYPPTDTLIVNNYPPLSFYVVGAVANSSASMRSMSAASCRSSPSSRLAA